MMVLEWLIDSEDNMKQLGRMIGISLQPGDIVYLQGVLGAGKTTLTQGILKGLQYNGAVTSPSFSLMNVYEGFHTVYHFDFYRLDSMELYDLGLEDYLEKDGICIIEWPEVNSGILPGDGLYVRINLVDDDYDCGRQVRITSAGNQYIELMERLSDVDVGSG